MKKINFIRSRGNTNIEIDPIHLEKIYKKNHVIFSCKILFLLVTYLFFGVLILSESLLYQIIGMFFIGLMFAHAVELQHELLHMNTGHKFVKLILGFLLGLPMLVSFSHYQFNHMNHHRLLGTPDDREFFSYDSRDVTIYSFIKSLFMVKQHLIVLDSIKKACLGHSLDISAINIGRRVRKEYIALGLFIIFLSFLSVMSLNYIVLKLWIIPLILIASPAHVLIELPEHTGCDKTPDIFRNTRTIASCKLMSWYVNGNNFHVEHHLSPSVPIHNLKKLHTFINDKTIYKQKSYSVFYKDFIRKLAV